MKKNQARSRLQAATVIFCLSAIAIIGAYANYFFQNVQAATTITYTSDRSVVITASPASSIILSLVCPGAALGTNGVVTTDNPDMGGDKKDCIMRLRVHVLLGIAILFVIAMTSERTRSQSILKHSINSTTA